ncbi:MAG: ATP-binding protein [Oscillospiraceae bacterium]|nr:ATP-binding protein [Oscillospiraceae bacterium]
MEIKRDTYLEKLKLRRKNGMIKVITGIRRCGKSYLMNEIFYNYLLSEGVQDDHIIRFAFDSAEDLTKIGENLLELYETGRKADPAKFMDYINTRISDKSDYTLLLDEVQLLAGFEAVLNGYLRKKNLDIYVTGSNSKFLSSDIITEFEGRGDEIHVMPLSFSEYMGVFDGSIEEGFDDYSVYGGLPAVALMKTGNQKTTYLDTQMRNVYLRDIVNRYHLQSNENIGEVVDILASGISSLINPKRISDTFRSKKKTAIAPDTVKKYISYMEDAFMIRCVKRFDVKGRHLIDTPYKVYFEDIGLRNARLEFRQLEQTHIMENIIYNELRYRGFSVNVGTVEIRETGTDGKEIKKQAEIDFIAVEGGKKYYIQSAYEISGHDKWVQETRGFDKTGDSFKKIVVVDRSMKPRRDEKGYVTIGIREFLLNPESMDL